MTDSGTAGFPVGEGTRAVRAGLLETAKHEQTLPGPAFDDNYHIPGDPTRPYTYGRDVKPTRMLL